MQKVATRILLYTSERVHRYYTLWCNRRPQKYLMVILFIVGESEFQKSYWIFTSGQVTSHWEFSRAHSGLLELKLSSMISADKSQGKNFHCTAKHFDFLCTFCDNKEKKGLQLMPITESLSLYAKCLFYWRKYQAF